MSNVTYKCSMEDDEHPVDPEAIRARDARNAANLYRLTVSSKGGPPGNIVIQDPQGHRTVFSWDELNVLDRY